MLSDPQNEMKHEKKMKCPIRPGGLILALCILTISALEYRRTGARGLEKAVKSKTVSGIMQIQTNVYLIEVGPRTKTRLARHLF